MIYILDKAIRSGVQGGVPTLQVLPQAGGADAFTFEGITVEDIKSWHERLYVIMLYHGRVTPGKNTPSEEITVFGFQATSLRTLCSTIVTDSSNRVFHDVMMDYGPRFKLWRLQDDNGSFAFNDLILGNDAKLWSLDCFNANIAMVALYQKDKQLKNNGQAGA